MNVTRVVDDILNKLLNNGFEEEDIVTSERNNLGYLDVLTMDSNCMETPWRIYEDICNTYRNHLHQDNSIQRHFRNRDA